MGHFWVQEVGEKGKSYEGKREVGERKGEKREENDWTEEERDGKGKSYEGKREETDWTEEDCPLQNRTHNHLRCRSRRQFD